MAVTGESLQTLQYCIHDVLLGQLHYPFFSCPSPHDIGNNRFVVLGDRSLHLSQHRIHTAVLGHSHLLFLLCLPSQQVIAGSFDFDFGRPTLAVFVVFSSLL